MHGAGGGGRGARDGVPLLLPPLQLRPHPRAGRAVRMVGLAGRPHGHQDVTSTCKLLFIPEIMFTILELSKYIFC